MISQAVLAAERFYPAFQLVTWGDDSPEKALDVAIAEALRGSLTALKIGRQLTRGLH